MIDQEPHRRYIFLSYFSVYLFNLYTNDPLIIISVQIIRRIDTRIPTPLLSAFMTPTTTAPQAGSGLGKLADFRAAVKATQTSSPSSSSPSWRPTAAVPPATATTATKSWNTTTQTNRGSSNAPTPTTQRGWTSVVASGASTSSSSSAANNTQSTHSSVFAPKPSTTSSSSEVVVPVSHSSILGAGSRTVSPALGVGSSLSRTVSPAQLPSKPVPEDWEDDV